MAATSRMYVKVYRYLLVVLLCSGGVPGTQVRWDMAESQWDAVLEGDAVKLKCVVRHLNSRFSAVSIERTSRGHSVLVATNQVVEDSFRNLLYNGVRRYSARFELFQENNGYIVILQLSIQKVQAEDAGLLRCKSEGESTPLKTLAVRVPVQQVYMRMFHSNDSSVKVADGATITMRENVRSGVACSVILRTDLIMPEVWLSSGAQNLTRLFSLEEPVPVEGSARPSYMWQYTFYTLRPFVDLHEQTLTCSAFAVGFENQVETASVNMVVEFRPRIACTQYEYLSHVGGSVTMACAVKSNPRAEIVFRFGYYLSDNEYNVSHPFMTDGRYIFTRTELPGGITNMTVTMQDLRKAHFDYTYKMDTMNPYGSASVTLTLYENGMAIGTASQRSKNKLGVLVPLTSIIMWLSRYLQR